MVHIETVGQARSRRTSDAEPSAAIASTLRRARDRIDREFTDEQLTIRRVADAAYLSTSYFVRAFTDHYGITPGKYLSRRRIERAMDLLRFANLTVTEVCHLVGFRSLGSFSSKFSATVGTSPSRFQHSWLGRSQPRIPGCELLMQGLRIEPSHRGVWPGLNNSQEA